MQGQLQSCFYGRLVIARERSQFTFLRKGWKFWQASYIVLGRGAILPQSHAVSFRKRVIWQSRSHVQYTSSGSGKKFLQATHLVPEKCCYWQERPKAIFQEKVVFYRVVR